MRVLMVTSQLPRPGRPGRMAPVARQIDSVRAVGIEVDVLEIGGGLPRLRYLQAVPRLQRRAPRVDLIHAHFGYSGWVARTQFGRPVVVSFMGSDLLGDTDARGRTTTFGRLVAAADRWLARFVDAVIVKSPEMAKLVAPVKAHVVPNGVDLEVFRPMDRPEARRQLGMDPDRRYVLFPSNPAVARKGFPLAKQAVEEASKLAGETLEIVTLWGVPPDRVPILMNACDVLLLTSFWEGSPNAVKEAMACEVPVVSVPVGDVPQLLEGVDGSAVRARDADALSQALAEVLSNPRRPAGREALRRHGLDLESVARRLVEIYEEVLARRRN